MAKPKDAIAQLPAAILSPGARYVGDGRMFVPGVPARDLTAAEWRALSEVERQVCLATGIYAVIADAPAPPAAQEG